MGKPLLVSLVKLQLLVAGPVHWETAISGKVGEKQELQKSGSFPIVFTDVDQVPGSWPGLALELRVNESLPECFTLQVSVQCFPAQFYLCTVLSSGWLFVF